MSKHILFDEMVERFGLSFLVFQFFIGFLIIPGLVFGLMYIALMNM